MMMAQQGASPSGRSHPPTLPPRQNLINKCLLFLGRLLVSQSVASSGGFCHASLLNQFHGAWETIIS